MMCIVKLTEMLLNNYDGDSYVALNASDILIVLNNSVFHLSNYLLCF